MKSLESFAKSSKENYEQQYVLNRQIHDAIGTIDRIFRPLVSIRNEIEPTAADIPTLGKQLSQLASDFIEANTPKSAEDSKLEYELNEFYSRIEDLISLIAEFSRKSELNDDDILEWESTKKRALEALDAIHMTVTGTVSSHQNLDNPRNLN